MALPVQARKVFPAYGKELAEARRRGLVPKLPGGFLWVAIGWEVHHVLGSAPHVVLSTDRPMGDYQLSFLAGLPLQVAYERDGWRLAHELVRALLQVRPGFLGSWCWFPSESWGCPRCHFHEHGVIDGVSGFQAVPVFDEDGVYVRV